MVQNPPEGNQRIIPYILYDDAPAALDFLCRAFGFTERFRIPMDDGALGHAEIAIEDNIVMLATAIESDGHASPRNLAARHSMICSYVDDVDSHFQAACEAGATIKQEPADQFYGDRTYWAEDPEGHWWLFHTHVKDVPLDELSPPEACS